MVNWKLLTPRNVVVIAAIAIAWHAIMSPVFASIAKPAPTEDDNS